CSIDKPDLTNFTVNQVPSRNLLESHKNIRFYTESISAISKNLEDLEQELKDYFEFIINKIDKIRNDAKRTLFQITLGIKTSLQDFSNFLKESDKNIAVIEEYVEKFQLEEQIGAYVKKLIKDQIFRLIKKYMTYIKKVKDLEEQRKIEIDATIKNDLYNKINQLKTEIPFPI
ncbi:unnamed protein product, partial [marine sediment metagenome]